MLLCAAWGQSPFRYQEVMVPMRDGVHLQTVMPTPVGVKEPLPIGGEVVCIDIRNGQRLRGKGDQCLPDNAQSPGWKEDAGLRPAQYGKSLNGYQLPVAMEVRRGRYLKSFENPEPLQPDAATLWDIPLRDRDHVFRKAHRIMVQVQSTWFPLSDRNPQKYVPSFIRPQNRIS
jgi:predicted acyl esterase